MTRRLLAAALLVSAAWAGVLAPAALGGVPACASGDGPHAALVVSTGSGTTAYCVALDAAEVSGLHLIELAHQQHGLAYAFGNGGLAICQLAGVGPTGSDCFAEYPSYWGYWHGGAGGWTWASTGAGSARIGDGDMDAWVWGTGDTAATHPKPPAVGLDDVCTLAPLPSSSPAPHTSAPAPAPTGTGTAAPAVSASPGAGGASAKPTRSPSSSGSPAASPSLRDGDATVVVVAGGLTAPPSGGGAPPTGLLLAGALAVALVVGGLYQARRRAARPRTGSS